MQTTPTAALAALAVLAVLVALAVLAVLAAAAAMPQVHTRWALAVCTAATVGTSMRLAAAKVCAWR
jgi:hypothetical protein